jgi:hypothetical protein
VAIRNVALPSGLKREYLKPERIQDAFWVKARRVVCEQCNNVWMSGLQDKAKPMMLPLIDATRTAGLRPTECAFLGSWGAVTGIMLEYHARNVVDEQRRSAVYGDVEHHSPAPNTAVFLTRVMPVDLEAAIGTLLLRTKEDQRAQVQCEIFTARSLGFLIFQGALYPEHFRKLARYSRFLRHVWPVRWVQPIPWAPELPLSIGDHVALAHEILRP